MVNERSAFWINQAAIPGGAPAEQVDYKFYCFDGEPKFLYVSTGMDRHETARMVFLNMDWARAPFGRPDYLPYEGIPPKPSTFDEMAGLAKSLAAGIPFVRVDFFEYKGRPRFSEMTFHPCAGFMPFRPVEWDRKIGDMLELPA